MLDKYLQILMDLMIFTTHENAVDLQVVDIFGSILEQELNLEVLLHIFTASFPR